VTVQTIEFKTTVLRWVCDAPGTGPDDKCPEGWATASPSSAERMLGAPGWLKLTDGRTLCPEHRPSVVGA
jgi:hypothetical protein